MCLVLVNAYNNGYEIRTSFDNDKTRNRENIIEQTLGYIIPFGVIRDPQYVGSSVTVLSCLTQITNLHLEDPNARAKSVS
ncbi:unnamed protein product [Brassica napus]|uniref:(rape) hypothetical protein n=1 Tax=Brassica napus TaxID=3708 RepID=A0A816ZS02_BRANA|nr:unnamed protein product [Brassica napus]